MDDYFLSTQRLAKRAIQLWFSMVHTLRKIGVGVFAGWKITKLGYFM